MGPTIHLVTAKELAEQGYLVPADVFLIRMPKPPHSYKKWPEAVRYGIVENFTRNKRIVELARHLMTKQRGPVVIMVERLAHGETLARELGTDFIAGNAPTGYRRAAWEGLRDGNLKVMVTSKIADEGLDIPPLAFLILAGGGKAPHLTVQRVGRGMRVAKGKDRLFVFDFLDAGKYLGKHAKQRAATYADQPAYTTTEVDFEEVLS